jgi:hypothetical protein
MKKILLIAALGMAGMTYAQAPSQNLTSQQEAQVQEIKKERAALHNAIDLEVDRIMNVTNLDVKKKSELTEIVGDRIYMIARVKREDLTGEQLKSRVQAIDIAYKKALRQFLGDDAFAKAMQPVGKK